MANEFDIVTGVVILIVVGAVPLGAWAVTEKWERDWEADEQERRDTAYERYDEAIPECTGSVVHYEVRTYRDYDVAAAIEVYEDKGWADITVDKKRGYTEVEATCKG